MEILLLQGKSARDIKMIAELAKRIGVSTSCIAMKDIEEVGLVKAMEKGRTGKYINTVGYIKKLKVSI